MEDGNNNVNKESKVDLISNDINQYIIGEKLGEGVFGTVKLGTHKITKEKVAIKILKKNRLTKDQKKLLDRELKIHKKLIHFNIIKLYSIIETESMIYLIQEYSEGKELSNYIQNHFNLEEKIICRFFIQIISGVEYMHNMGIAHRDLKPENILLTTTNDIKITDFGLSTFYNKGKLLKTSCGSPYFAPPEMLRGKPYDGLLSDIYSCGVILYYMLTHKLPFNEQNESDTYKKILECKFDIPKDISKNAKNLIKKMIKLKPDERIKITEIKKHPWFKLFNEENNIHKGLDEKKIIFPIDEEIVKNMEEIGFNKMEVRYNIIKNEHNNITATYYLLLNKKINKGRKSVSDLCSNLYEEYINDPKNKIENYNNNLEEAIKHRINSKKILDITPDFIPNKINNKNESSEIKNNKDKNNNINETNIKTNNKNIIIKTINNKQNQNNNKKNNPKIDKQFINKQKEKSNITIKVNKKPNIKLIKRERNLSARMKPKNNLILDFKNNINNKKLIKPKIIINKTIQNNKISTIQCNKNNKIKRHLSIGNKNIKPKIEFNGIFTPKYINENKNIIKTKLNSSMIKNNKKKLSFLNNNKKIINISSSNIIKKNSKINSTEKSIDKKEDKVFKKTNKNKIKFDCKFKTNNKY